MTMIQAAEWPSECGTAWVAQAVAPPRSPAAEGAGRRALIYGEKRDPIAFDVDDLAQTMVAAFRRHPHINNVMTHLCGAQWARVEQALREILDSRKVPDPLSPLAENLVELMDAERGVTGRILKPYVRELLDRTLPHALAVRLLEQMHGHARASAMRALHEPRPAGGPVSRAIASVGAAPSGVRDAVRPTSKAPSRMLSSVSRVIRRFKCFARMQGQSLGASDMGGRTSRDRLDGIWAAARIGLCEYPGCMVMRMEKLEQERGVSERWRL